MSATSPAQLRAAVLYTRGKALGGTARDDELIVDAFRRNGLAAESIDLANLRQAADGTFLLRQPKGRLETALRSAIGLDPAPERVWTAPDAVLMYHGALSPANTAPMLDALEGAGSFVINGRKAWQTMTDKGRFYHVMKQAGVPTIETREVRSHADAVAALREFGYPAVFKKPISTEGDDVYIVSSEAELRRQVTSRLDELGGRVIAQPFVESRIAADRIEPAILAKIGREAIGMRNDFRIMTVRGMDGTPHVTATFHRVAQDADQAVNNVAKGSRAVRIEFSDLDPRDQATVLKAIQGMPDGQVVGWDLIGQPGQRVIMEANSGPGLPTTGEGFRAEEVLQPYANLAREGAELAARTRATAAAAAG